MHLKNRRSNKRRFRRIMSTVSSVVSSGLLFGVGYLPFQYGSGTANGISAYQNNVPQHDNNQGVEMSFDVCIDDAIHPDGSPVIPEPQVSPKSKTPFLTADNLNVETVYEVVVKPRAQQQQQQPQPQVTSSERVAQTDSVFTQNPVVTTQVYQPVASTTQHTNTVQPQQATFMQAPAVTSPIACTVQSAPTLPSNAVLPVSPVFSHLIIATPRPPTTIPASVATSSVATPAGCINVQLPTQTTLPVAQNLQQGAYTLVNVPLGSRTNTYQVVNCGILPLLQQSQQQSPSKPSTRRRCSSRHSCSRHSCSRSAHRCNRPRRFFVTRAH